MWDLISGNMLWYVDYIMCVYIYCRKRQVRYCRTQISLWFNAFSPVPFHLYFVHLYSIDVFLYWDTLLSHHDIWRFQHTIFCHHTSHYRETNEESLITATMGHITVRWDSRQHLKSTKDIYYVNAINHCTKEEDKPLSGIKVVTYTVGWPCIVYLTKYFPTKIN